MMSQSLPANTDPFDGRRYSELHKFGSICTLHISRRDESSTVSLIPLGVPRSWSVKSTTLSYGSAVIICSGSTALEVR